MNRTTDKRQRSMVGLLGAARLQADADALQRIGRPTQKSRIVFRSTAALEAHQRREMIAAENYTIHPIED
jgi:hypothetical protein